MNRCKHCQQDFENLNSKQYANHVRWCLSNPNGERNNLIKCEFCDFMTVRSSIKGHTETCVLNPKCSKECLECGKLVLDKENKFCNHSCSASFSNRNRDCKSGPPKGYSFPLKEVKCAHCSVIFTIKSNIHKTKGKYCDACYISEKINVQTFKNVNCFICNKSFIIEKSSLVKTCGKECYRKILSINAILNPNCGGETNYRKFKYNGITMDSSWEVEIAKYMDAKGITWERSREHMFWWTDQEGRDRRYYPDFYIKKYDYYLDTKNKWLMEKDAFKLKAVVERNNIKLKAGDVQTIKAVIDSW